MSHSPLRRCIGCREMHDKSNLLRITKSGAQTTIDITGKAPGRGAYLCKIRACYELAAKNKGLERSFKVKVPPDVYALLLEAIEAV